MTRLGTRCIAPFFRAWWHLHSVLPGSHGHGSHERLPGIPLVRPTQHIGEPMCMTWQISSPEPLLDRLAALQWQVCVFSTPSSRCLSMHG